MSKHSEAVIGFFFYHAFILNKIDVCVANCVVFWPDKKRTLEFCGKNLDFWLILKYAEGTTKRRYKQE